MHDVPRYLEFAFPLHEVPREGHAVTRLDVANTVPALLRGVHGLLTALAEAHFRTALNHQETHHAILTLAGQVHLALHILDRWGKSSDFWQPPSPAAEVQP